eukprot:4584415-Amphidinium_carterae.1
MAHSLCFLKPRSLSFPSPSLDHATHMWIDPKVFLVKDPRLIPPFALLSIVLSTEDVNGHYA